MATHRLMWAVGLLIAAGLVVGIVGAGYSAWAAALICLLAAAIFDGWTVAQRAEPTVDRTVDRSLALGVDTEVELTIRFPDGRPARIELADGVPPQMEADDVEIDATVGGESTLRINYPICPAVRGTWQFEPAHVRVHGPLGLMSRQIRCGDTEEVRVVPNFRAVSHYALMALADRKGQIGVRQLRRRGEGMEFDCLREYREGDQLRQIDWKATARHRRVIARQYEDERNQQVVLVFDCGRRMRATDGELSHFDHSLNAGLLLSYVALRQGDSVSVGTFGGVDRWVSKRRGPDAVDTIVNQTFDLQTTLAPSDFSEAARRLTHRQKRRGLIIFLTNLYDADPDELQQALDLLGDRHLVLVASLRESAVDELAETDVRTHEQALQVGATHHFLDHRRQLHAQLEKSGGMLLDVQPQDLSVALVNRYLEIKRAGRL